MKISPITFEQEESILSHFNEIENEITKKKQVLNNINKTIKDKLNLDLNRNKKAQLKLQLKLYTKQYHDTFYYF